MIRSAAFFLVAILAGAQLSAEQGLPEWAYGTAPSPAIPSQPKKSDEARPLPGSDFKFTQKQANDPFNPADWYPQDHPKMPSIVATGRKPNIWACDLCHFPNGKGKPENAGVAGLPVSYFIHQMHDFRDGLRTSADTRKKNTNLMIVYAKSMTDSEIEEAAQYFGSMAWTPWIRVVETETVPKTRLSVGMYMPLEGNEREPIGQRIIETPQEPERTEELRDPRSGFVAYVPVGSVAKGRELATTGGQGKTVACAVCHGPDLKGTGPVTGIAGRSPSYVARQLVDMRQGTRKGEWTELMKPVVTHLTDEDVLNIAAYTASLRP